MTDRLKRDGERALKAKLGTRLIKMANEALNKSVRGSASYIVVGSGCADAIKKATEKFSRLLSKLLRCVGDSTAERSEGEAGIPLKIKYLFIPATPILSE